MISELTKPKHPFIELLCSFQGWQAWPSCDASQLDPAVVPHHSSTYNPAATAAPTVRQQGSMKLVYSACTDSTCRRLHARQFPGQSHPAAAAAVRQRSHSRSHHHHRNQRQQQQSRVLQAAAQNEPAAPENVDLSDPELQMQIDALLQELDPDMLMVSPLCDPHACVVPYDLFLSHTGPLISSLSSSTDSWLDFCAAPKLTIQPADHAVTELQWPELFDPMDLTQ